jgi:hypothetical protein
MVVVLAAAVVVAKARDANTESAIIRAIIMAVDFRRFFMYYITP